jgi:hypothetical protein
MGLYLYGIRLTKMTVEITLPLLGTYQVWAGLPVLAVGWAFLIALFLAIHFDNKKEEN